MVFLSSSKEIKESNGHTAIAAASQPSALLIALAVKHRYKNRGRGCTPQHRCRSAQASHCVHTVYTLCTGRPSRAAQRIHAHPRASRLRGEHPRKTDPGRQAADSGWAPPQPRAARAPSAVKTSRTRKRAAPASLALAMIRAWVVRHHATCMAGVAVS